MVTVCGSQRQEPVPDTPFDRSRRRLVGETELAELPSRLETGVDKGAVHGHDLECADDLIAGADLGSVASGDGGQGEQVVLRSSLGAGEEVTTEGHHVAVTQDQTFPATGASNVHGRAAGGGL